MGLQAAAYCRISDDRTGEGLGVGRQRADCLALASSRGWDLTTYVDNDVSAYSGKPRKQYAAMLDAMRAGQVQAVVAWHADRLHRSPRELEEFISVVEAHGVVVETVQSGQVDLSTPSGRVVARTLGNFARYESEHKAERVKRALAQRAEQGKAHGRYAYGWTHAGRIKASEQTVVVEAATRIVEGDSLRGIVADWNARGVPSPSGKPWGKTMLRHLVTRERNVALLVRHGEVVGPGDWPPLLERDLWDQARTVLTDPGRRTSTSSAAVHLLSGIARCGVCGGPMRAGMNRTTPSYRCAERSCVARNRAPVDELVTAVVLARLALPDALHLGSPERRDEVRQATAEADGLRARLNVAADDYADGKIDAEQLERITARLRPKLDRARAASRVVDDTPLLAGLVGAADMPAVWDGMALSRRRAVVDLLLSVRVLRGRRGAREFDPESVEIAWRS